MMVSHARSLIGLSWRHRGRSRRGIDCVGLLVLSAHAAGHSIPDATHYGRYPWEDRLRRELREAFGAPIWSQTEPVVGEWLAGDVALISWRRGEPSHVGLIADYLYGGLSIIHCENINGCVEHPVVDHFFDCVTEVYRPWPAKSSQ